MKYLLCLLLFAGCSKEKAAPQAPVFPVRVTTVTEQAVPIYLEALGHVDPIVSIEIKSRIEGELTGIFFKQGQEVKQNDLLFTIDPKPYEAALAEARGTLDEQKARLAIAQEKVKRYKVLTQEEYYSQIDYESLQADFAATQGLVEQATGSVQSAEINLNYCKIYAPINGLMGILQVDYGNLVTNGGQTLVVLNQIAPIYVTFSVPEVDLGKIQKYRRCAALKTVAAYENFNEETFDGTLDIVDNQVDPKTGMIKLRATFTNANRELWPGQFIRTRLVLTTEPNAKVIPATAVQLTLHGPVGFVVKPDGTVEERPLKLGPRQDDVYLVAEGLKTGETIVTEGQINLSTGSKVRVMQ